MEEGRRGRLAGVRAESEPEAPDGAAAAGGEGSAEPRREGAAPQQLQREVERLPVTRREDRAGIPRRPGPRPGRAARWTGARAPGRSHPGCWRPPSPPGASPHFPWAGPCTAPAVPTRALPTEIRSPSLDEMPWARPVAPSPTKPGGQIAVTPTQGTPRLGAPSSRSPRAAVLWSRRQRRGWGGGCPGSGSEEAGGEVLERQLVPDPLRGHGRCGAEERAHAGLQGFAF